MTDETSSSTDTASLDSNPVDAISDLLTGGSENSEVTEDTDEEETLTDESNQDDETSEEEGTEEEETHNEPDEEDDATWASTLGVEDTQLDFDDEGNFSGVNVKVNGESSKVKMTDLIAGYQNAKSFTQKSQTLSDERKVFDGERENVAKEYKLKLDNVLQLNDMLANKLTSEYDNVNWEALRQENPAEYAALRQDYSSKASELQRSQQAIAYQQQLQEQEKAQNFATNNKTHLKEQWETMLVKNPTWTDNKVHEKDMGEMRSFMDSQYGFNTAEFANVSDARLIEVMKDAMAYRNGVKTAKKKLMKKVPKFQKSTGKKKQKVNKLDSLTKRAKSSIGADQRGAQVDAIAELLG